MDTALQFFGSLSGFVVLGAAGAIGAALTLWGGVELFRHRHQPA